MYRGTETEDRRRRQQAEDLHLLRMLAWCVKRHKYNRERVRWDGGHRGTAKIATVTFYLEAADYRDADRAVREIIARQDEV